MKSEIEKAQAVLETMKRLAAIEEELMQLQKLAGICADGQTERVEVSITVFREQETGSAGSLEFVVSRPMLERFFGGVIVGSGVLMPGTTEEVEEAFVDSCNADIALRYIQLMHSDREKEKKILTAKLKNLISK